MMRKASNSASRRSRASSTRSCQMPLPSRNGGSPKKAPIAVRRIVAFGSRPASMPSPNQGRNESTSESEDPPEPQSDGTIRLSFLWHIRVGALSIWKTIAGSFHELVYLAGHSFGHLAIFCLQQASPFGRECEALAGQYRCDREEAARHCATSCRHRGKLRRS